MHFSDHAIVLSPSKEESVLIGLLLLAQQKSPVQFIGTGLSILFKY
jgi:hypothetical protein